MESANDSLLAVAAAGDVGACRLHLSRGADVNYRNSDGKTALINAAFKGHLEVCVVLLAVGASVHTAGYGGRTALHMAASHGHAAICELLLDSGAVIEEKSNGGITPLHGASSNRQLAVCRLLIAHGADVCAAPADKWTPLHCSIFSSKLCAVLLAEGAQASVHTLTAKTFGGAPLQSPLDVAVGLGLTPSCQLLVAHCSPLPTDCSHLRKLGLPANAEGYVAAIRDGGWQRRLAALHSYVNTNGHTRGW